MRHLLVARGENPTNKYRTLHKVNRIVVFKMAEPIWTMQDQGALRALPFCERNTTYRTKQAIQIFIFAGKMPWWVEGPLFSYLWSSRDGRSMKQYLGIF
jgi:hypothetical protein